jgi:hypothetical protein
VIAHERGHLLLPSSAHSSRGIMREKFDFVDRTLQRLTREEIALIKTGLVARLNGPAS